MQPLHLIAERLLAVSTLSLPEPGPQGLESIERATSVELFVERCRGLAGSFDLDVNNAQSVASICHRLDGLPLAIEIAALRIRTIPPAAMLEHMPHLADLRSSLDADRPARHRTLRATVD